MHSRFWWHKRIYVKDVSQPGYAELMRRARAGRREPLDLQKAVWTLLLTASDKRRKRRHLHPRRFAQWATALLTLCFAIAIVITTWVKPATGLLTTAVGARLEHWVDWL